ncbi:MAG: MraY family glycosyltransferase [Culicoidibacterales bacterium]
MTAIEILTILVTCFAISWLSVPFVKKMAVQIGAVDYPDTKRKFHKGVMPRLGGLSIFLSFLIGYVLFGSDFEGLDHVLVGAFIIILIGMYDDIAPIKPLVKFGGQILAAVIVIYSGQFMITEFVFIPGLTLQFPEWFSPIFTLLWIVGITNAVNLIDGLDGLASGISAITLTTLAFLAVFDGSYFAATVTLILLGSTLGFIVFNFPPASIFMGDTGSNFLGFMIAVLSILGYKQAAFASFFMPIVMLGVPILDTFVAIIRRKLRGQSIGEPDREHLHHKLLDSTESSTKTLLIIYGISVLFSATAVVYGIRKIWGLFLLGFLLIFVEIFIEKYELIGPKYKPVFSLLEMLKIRKK